MSPEVNTSKFVKANDITLHYNEIGDPAGEPVVWIHGGGPGATALSNFSRNMAGMSKYRNLLFDMPQYGQSDKPVIKDPRLAFNASHVISALDNLGVEKAHFVGNSMGGGTSAKVAMEAPEKVDRLVLMGAAGVFPEGMEMPKGIGLLMSYFQPGGASPEKMGELIRTFVYDSSVLTEELIQSRYEASIDPEILAAREASEAMALEDITEGLGRIQSKTLLLWGRDDLFVPLESGLTYEREIPDARLFVVPNCGHWVQWEHVDLFNSLVEQFLVGELDG
ncbi:MAG: alpha/beta fold hydrolase [Ilumatobacteraceae bacterium]|nr:alpha/beta fold hydrolase [Ilumatobacteraceae bacterium]